ncbi:MAG: phosphonate C-P lyase system protein PhnG [Hyphomicrobiales bacterium]
MRFDDGDGARIASRQEAMRILAMASTADLSAAWETWPEKPEVDDIRNPETGLVMLRGRIGGDGQPFNFGEATVTRATVRLGAAIGHGYVLGRDRQEARLAAIFDALWRGDARTRVEEEDVLRPIRDGIAEGDARVAAETAATRVDFFTLVRGED